LAATQKSPEDARLAELLIGAGADTIVLAGKAVHRLNKDLTARAQNLSQENAEFKPPVVEQVPSLQDLAHPRDEAAISRVLCLSLPTSEQQVESSLGLACRFYPKLVLLEHVSDEKSTELLPDEQFFAHGFRLLGKTLSPDSQRSVYAYSLRDYKQAPDWLNARFWAHPERFDLQD